MGTRLGFLLFLVPLLVFACAHSQARKLETPQHGELEAVELEEFEMNEKSCFLCEHFARQAAEYIKENRTQVEMIEVFHKICLRLPSFRQQCTIMVDYYAPLFFLEVSTMSPHDLCTKINFCKHAPSPPPAPMEDSPPTPLAREQLNGEHICEVCHTTVFKLLSRLKDPGTELRIVERLVKGCVVADHFADKCQSLIFQYGPVILVNVVRLLERADLCVTVQACPKGKNETNIVYPPSPAPVYSLFEDM